MIFFVVGIILVIIGAAFTLFPSKKINALYGYRSVKAEETTELWQYAQRVSGRYFLLFGALMAAIGWVLRVTGNTNFFLIEMMLLVFPIMPIFLLTEQQLRKYEQTYGSDDDEHFDD